MSESAPDELTELLSSIAYAAEQSVGVDTYEYLLADLLALLESDRVARTVAVAELRRLATDWPWGSVEALEFTMRRLRWPEVREALESHRAQGADFRTCNLATQVLEVYQDDWPAGEIYEAYRRSDS